MPIYTFACSKCGHQEDHMVGITQDCGAPACPHCGSPEVTRVFTVGAKVRSKNSDLSTLQKCKMTKLSKQPE